MQPSRARQPITRATRLFYGFGSIAYGVKDQGFSYLLLLYYNQVLHVPAQAVGLALLIVLLVDACIDPLIGHWSDTLRSRWGRRHPFMYATAVPVAIFYLLLWQPPSGLSSAALFFYLIGVATMVRFLISLYEIPSAALAPELTDSYHDRTSLLGLRYLFGWLGGLTMAFLAFAVFLRPDAAHPVGQLNPAGYGHYGWTAAAIMLGAILISALGTHRHIPDLQVPPPKRETAWRRSVGEVVESLSHRSLLMLLGAGLFAGTAIGLVTSLTNYFLTFFWELSAAQISILLFSSVIAAFLAVPSANLLSRRIGKKPAVMAFWLLCLVVAPLTLVLRVVGFFPANGDRWLLPLLFVHAAVYITLFIAASILIASMIADVVEDQQVTTGRRAEGLFFAANAFIQKFTSGIGIYGAGLLLSVIAFPQAAKPGQIDPAVLQNLALLFVFLVTVLFLTAVAFVSAYRIDRGTHEANLARLAAAGSGPVPRAAEWDARDKSAA